jgi:hypothetical protein
MTLSTTPKGKITVPPYSWVSVAQLNSASVSLLNFFFIASDESQGLMGVREALYH